MRLEPLRQSWAARFGSERSGTPATGGPTMAASEPVPRAPAATTRMWTGDRRRRDGALVPPAKPTSYYGRPIIKPPPWKVGLIGAYFLCGGMAGASAALGSAAHLAGERELERRAWVVSLAGLAVSPPLLIADLGRPMRFLNMLRVFKVTSPMSVGAWILAATSAAAAPAALSSLTGRLPRLGSLAALPAGLLGTTLATYTGGLLSDTSVPAWHEARYELPFVFAGSAMASAGGASLLATPPPHSEPARRLLLVGATLETVASRVMEHRLGELAAPYRVGRPGRLSRAALIATGAGAAIAALAGRRRAGGAVAGALTFAGSGLERLAVLEAGISSARDPQAVVAPQRRRVEERRARAAGAPPART